MGRNAQVSVLLLPATTVGRADDGPGLKDAAALEKALQLAILQAEPSVASIFVSRSDAYQKLFGETPSLDNPGKLGPFQFPSTYRSGIISEDELNKEKRRYELDHPEYVPEAYGSGVVVDDKGLILTNYHVVRDAAKVYVRVPGNKHGSYADIHAADPRSDLAVLRLLSPDMKLRAIKLGDGDKVRKGSLVLSIANPFAAGFRDGSPSASWGIISNVRRSAPHRPITDEGRLRLPLHYYGTLLQTDARLNLGCSGGALIDLDGEMVGLTTALAAVNGSETAGGFAVPMTTGFRRVVEVLKTGSEMEYGFLGVRPNFAAVPDQGVAIEHEASGSPAARAGLPRNCRILSINGTPVDHVFDLFLHIGLAQAGSRIELEVATPFANRSQKISAHLGKFYVPGKIIVSKKRPMVRGLRVDYATVPRLRDPVPAQTPYPEGVWVREVESGSPADTAKLQDSIITRVNDQAVQTPADFYRIVDKLNGPWELTLLGRDPGESRKVTLP